MIPRYDDNKTMEVFKEELEDYRKVANRAEHPRILGLLTAVERIIRHTYEHDDIAKDAGLSRPV